MLPNSIPQFCRQPPWFVSKPCTGFTQIELIITVVVVGILAAITFPSLAPWWRQQQVNAALGQIDIALQETQTEAVKRNQICRLMLTRATEPVITGTCLRSGDRTLKGVTLDHSRRNDTWIISFNAAGENRTPANDPGTLWLSAPGVQSKCMVISVGIGLRRTGLYTNNACRTP